MGSDGRTDPRNGAGAQSKHRPNCATILFMDQNGQASPGQVDGRESALLVERVRRMAEGDEKALAELYDMTVNCTYALALRVTQRREIADEVVSDVYVQAWRSAARYDATRSTVKGWLSMLCRSRAIDALRREGPDPIEAHRDLEAIPDTGESTQQDLAMALDRSTALHQAIAALEETHRQLISLAYYRGMTHAELATCTGMPLGTVKTKLRQAYAVLRKALTASEAAREDVYEP